MADSCQTLVAAAQDNAAAVRNTAVVAYVKEHVGDTVDKAMVDFFLLTVVDFAGEQYPIPGEEAMKWLDYGRNDNFKRFYTKHLDEGVDYLIPLQPEGNSTVGRPAAADARFTIDGFKALCMLAGTDQGSRVRGYYRALERVHAQYFANAQKEAEALLETERAEKDALRLELTEHVKDAERMKRRFADGHKGDVTYIFKDSSVPADLVYNVGETMDIARREQDYNTHNYSGDIIFTKRCLNRKILERMTHHMLDQFRVMRKREWFKATEDVIQDTLETAQAVLDGYVDRCGNLHASGVGAKIRELIAAVPRDDAGLEVVQAYELADAASTSVPVTPAAHQLAPVVDVDPSNYATFISDACALSSDAFTLPVELVGAHRLWGRCSDEAIRNGLYKYLNERFPRVKKLFPDNSFRFVHPGVSLKPLAAITPPSPTSTDIETFLHAECREDFVGRVALATVCERFSAWKRACGGDAEYKMCSIDKRRIEEHLAKFFLRGTPCTGRTNEVGYFGLRFKDDTLKVGVRSNSNLKKRVAVLDPSSQPARLVGVFESVNACAIHFQVEPASISTDLSSNRKRRGLIIRWVKDIDQTLLPDEPGPSAPPVPARVRVPKAGQWRKKVVQEVDSATGEVVHSYDSVTSAAAAACIHAARMSRIISQSLRYESSYYRFAPQA